MGGGGHTLRSNDKPFELSMMLVRLCCSLDSITGGDDAIAQAWTNNHNTAVGGSPLTLVQTVHGLANVIAYLDARRDAV